MLVDVTDVARLVEARRSGVAPDHEDRLASRVLEPVVVVLGNEHDFAWPELDVGIPDACNAVARDEVLELLRVRVPVDVVLRSGRKNGYAENRVGGPDGVACQEPADVHVDPAVLRTQAYVARRRLEALLHWVLRDPADSL